MKSVQFIFGLHDHQPVGNFGHVFEDAYRLAYEPFLELLEFYSHFRVALHHTGPLLQWLAQNKPGYFDRLGTLVQRGQVEILGGAFYEPILPIIPEADRIGQIVAMSDWLEQMFGVRPRGMWLAERVWEPTLPRAMKAAGIEFTVLDDSHFKAAGIGEEGGFGYYLTEDQGDAVAVFPINEFVRHSIPYASPKETIDYLKKVADDRIARTVVMADDGEKFGVWPESHWHCYQDGWMYRFVEMIINNREWLEMKFFGEVLDETAPMGRVYLPTASYVEMMEWAMPPRAIKEYNGLVTHLKKQDIWKESKVYVRGGFWRGFLSKYDEANHLHKRMLHVSRKLNNAPEAVRTKPEFAEALDHLWKSQCNCGYWHGVFGGLYLTNLRTALYQNLIAAEATVDALTHKGTKWVDIEARDLDVDGSPELIVDSPAQTLIFKPASGGMLIEHDLRDIRFNLLDTLSRRRESYHAEFTDAEKLAKLRAKETNLDKLLAEDWYRRGALIDHFLDEKATPESFRFGLYPETGDFVNAPYGCEWKKGKADAEISLGREGVVDTELGTIPVRVAKTIRILPDHAGYEAVYQVTNIAEEDPLRTRLGVEFNANLLAGDAPDRYHEVWDKDLGDSNKMTSIGATPEVSTFALTDEWLRFRLKWELSVPAEHWRLPIETVSMSEAGVERVYQSTVVMPVWDIDLEPGATFEVAVRLGVEYL